MQKTAIRAADRKYPALQPCDWMTDEITGEKRAEARPLKPITMLVKSPLPALNQLLSIIVASTIPTSPWETPLTACSRYMLTSPLERPSRAVAAWAETVAVRADRAATTGAAMRARAVAGTHAVTAWAVIPARADIPGKRAKKI